jgi:hypothetical protein
MNDSVFVIYEYFNSRAVVQNRKQPNRTKIRSKYDPDVEFTRFSYHPVWNKTNRSFIRITFANLRMKMLFEIEFAAAQLAELNEMPVMEKVELYEFCST